MVYRISPAGEAFVLYSANKKEITAITLDEAGNIYAAVGLRDTRTGDMLAQLPEVQEIHHIAGEDCFLVKVRVRDARTLGRLLRERFGADAGVRSTRTTIVLESVRESGQLPLPAPSAVPAEEEELAAAEVHHA